jgi:hypothetical protein
MGDKARQGVDEGCLACAIRTDQSNELTLAHLDVHISEGMHSTEANREV